MKSNVRAVTIGSALALALAFAGAGCVEEPAEADVDTGDETSAEPDYLTEELVAAVGNLEQAFSEQFVAGQINREALADEVAALVAAAPEEDGPAIEEHVSQQLDGAEATIPTMTAEEREALAYSTSDDSTGETEQALGIGWGRGLGWGGGVGWGGARTVGFGRLGFGGIGAFGFPGAFGGVGFRPGFGMWGTGMGWGARGLGFGGVGFNRVGWGGGVGWGGVGVGRRLW